MPIVEPTHMGRAQQLTTGQVARLLSVTPDTVLKWIKKGRVPATQTAGGHYRVAREHVEHLFPQSAGLATNPAPSGLVYCWEFYSDDGAVGESCKECLVYKARALRCYKMSALSHESGFSGTFCKTSCSDCPYYREQLQRERRVLVVTDSVRLRERLALESKDSPLLVRFATCEYECAAQLEKFQPHFVVIDCMLPHDTCNELCSHVSSDPRVPGVQIILTTPGGRRNAGSGADEMRSQIPWSFSIRDLEDHIAGAPWPGVKEVAAESRHG
jgi:excisionase family DNA binding protein